MKKLTFQPTEKQEFRYPTHKLVEEIIDKTIPDTKHGKRMRQELRIGFYHLIRFGEWGFNAQLMQYLTSKADLKPMNDVLSQIATKVNHSSFPGTKRCRMWKLKMLPGIRLNTEGVAAPGERKNKYFIEPEYEGWKSIEPEYMAYRHKRWCDFCNRRGWEQNVDIDGSTPWGKQTLDTLEKTELPEEYEVSGLLNIANEDIENIPPEKKAKLEWALKRVKNAHEKGIPRLVKRVYGRMYHPLTNLTKEVRGAIRIDGEEVVEVDLHAAYLMLAISSLPHGKVRSELEAMLQEGNIYEQLSRKAFDQHVKTQLELGRTGPPEEMSKPADQRKPWNLKQEFQRQIMLGSDKRKYEKIKDGIHAGKLIPVKPMWDDLMERYPLLAKAIEKEKNRKGGVKAFAKRLMQQEARIMVDGLTSKLEACALGIHDGVLVVRSKVEEIRKRLGEVIHYMLSITPCIKVKTLSRATVPPLEGAKPGGFRVCPATPRVGTVV